jgi:hypothetical protein
MDNRIITIFAGIGISIIGFAYAFSKVNQSVLYYLNYYHWYQFAELFSVLYQAYPNLLSGGMVGLGGIVIALIGNFYFKNNANN